MELNKSWYTSKAIWGALVAGAAALLNAYTTVDLDAGEIESITQLIVDVVGIVGSGLAVYGRITADKKIGVN
jgi:hypothetical protein